MMEHITTYPDGSRSIHRYEELSWSRLSEQFFRVDKWPWLGCHADGQRGEVSLIGRAPVKARVRSAPVDRSRARGEVPGPRQGVSKVSFRGGQDRS
jgi:hypothetical protein